MNATAHVTTFYSFKGGVGRTLLLANIGAILAARGRKVLLWDLDIEAPGMHRIPALEPAEPPRKGFLEWLRDWDADGREIPVTEARLAALTRAVRPVPGTSNLCILPAFGEDADFADLYREIDWTAFMVHDAARGLDLFRAALAALLEAGQYDHVLIDSRTGLTDLGGLLAAILPHATVLVASYGHQNTAGLLHVRKALQRAVDGRLAERGDMPPLDAILVASPVPADAVKQAEKRRGVWTEVFKTPPLVEVPWDRRLLFEEQLLGVEDAGCPAGAAYAAIADHISDLHMALLATLRAAELADAARPDLGRATGPGARKRRGLSFEDRVAGLLSLLGYTVEREQVVGGNKVDLIARRSGAFQDECYLVECKDHRVPVGKDVLENLEGWTRGDDARRMLARGMVVAHRFTPAASTHARDRESLVAVTPEDLESRLFDPKPYLARIRVAFEGSELARTYVSQRVLLESDPASAGSGLLDHAAAWAKGAGSRLWLLLGDYGTGKSAFFRRFAYDLALRASADPAAPFPIAIDLKKYPNAISLDSLIQDHLRTEAGWTGDPRIILHLLAAGRAVLLLDAFDEMGVAAAGRSVEDQFRQLAAAAGDEPADPRGNRVLITCRTHFFRDQQQVKDTAAGRIGDASASADSELGRLARRFEAAIDEMLLFDDAQIRTYLTLHLGEKRAGEALAFIGRTYDLARLAPRPVLLELIGKSLPKLAAEGGAVRAADLYRHYTDLWLEERSGMALQTPPELRRAILQALAFDLWGRAERRIHHRDLIGVLRSWPGVMFRGLDLERVDFELRTAAFLTRTADGFYGFSHKSFLEFFLARHLVDLLDAGSLGDALDTAPIGAEVSSFLLDLASGVRAAALAGATAAVLAAPYRPRASENALRLAAHALRRAVGDRYFPGSGAHLEGATLDGEDLSGSVLPGAHLCGASMVDASLRGAVLEGADLTGARLIRADLSGVRASKANFAGGALDSVKLANAALGGARFDGAVIAAGDFADSDCREASFERADLHGARFARADLTAVSWAGAAAPYATAAGCSGPPPPGSRPVPRKGVIRAPWAGGGIKSLAFSLDGAIVATGSLDGAARLWDARTCQEIQTLLGHGGLVSSVAFSSDGVLLATGASDGTARLWKTCNGQEVHALVVGNRGPVRSVAFSPDGVVLATGSDDKTVRLWNVRSGRQVLALEGHGGAVNCVAFSPDGALVATGSDDGEARLWDAGTGQQVSAVAGPLGPGLAIAFSPDGALLAIGSGDGTTRLWDACAGIQVGALEGHRGSVRGIAFSPDGALVGTCSDDSTARIWDARTGRLVRALPGHDGEINSVAFSRDGALLATGGDDGTARLWDPGTGLQVRELGGGRGNSVTSVAFSPDGERVAIGTFYRNVRLWDARTGRPVHILEGHRRFVTSVVFSPEGTLVATGSEDSTARLWDAQTGRAVRALEGHGGRVTSVAFSPDGRLVATGSLDQTARLWDAGTGRQVLALGGHRSWINSVAFSPDGALVATAAHDMTVRLWDASTGVQVLALEGHADAVTGVAFSPDGALVATGSYDRTARLWDVRTGGKVLTLEGHRDWVRTVAFSPDGALVATCSDDHTGRLWDARTGRQILALEGHESWVVSLAFSPDGFRVVTGSYDGTARVWDARSGGFLVAYHPDLRGWAASDAAGRWDGEGDGPDLLSVFDPDEAGPLRTVWRASDLPHLRMPGGK